MTANIHGRPLKRLYASVAGLVLLLAIAVQAAQAEPKLFSKLSLAKAQEKAAKSNKFVIADFTATWCGPCRMMDQNTWVHPSVEKWVGANAIAVQIDVDRDADVASDCKIRAMPTVIVFAPPDTKKEAARGVGYREPEQLLKWLEGIKSGKRSTGAPGEGDLETGSNSGRKNVDDHYKAAEAAFQSGEFDVATNEYLWLWNNMVKEDASTASVRTSFVASSMGDLAERHPAAKAKFEELRSKARSQSDFDWVVLNEVTNHPEETVKWFDSVCADPQQRVRLLQMGNRLTDLLVEHGRWAAVGKLWTDPQAELKHRYQVTSEIRRNTVEHPNLFPHSASVLYASLLAAGRKDEAAQVLTESMALENTKEMRDEFAVAAQNAGQGGPAAGLDVPTGALAAVGLAAVAGGGFMLWKRKADKKA